MSSPTQTTKNDSAVEAAGTAATAVATAAAADVATAATAVTAATEVAMAEATLVEGATKSYETLLQQCKLAHEASLAAIVRIEPKVRMDHGGLNKGDLDLDIHAWITEMSVLMHQTFSDCYDVNGIGEKTSPMVPRYKYIQQLRKKAMHDYTTDKTIGPILQNLNTTISKKYKGSHNVAHYLELTCECAASANKYSNTDTGSHDKTG